MIHVVNRYATLPDFGYFGLDFAGLVNHAGVYFRQTKPEPLMEIYRSKVVVGRGQPDPRLTSPACL